MLRDAAPLHDIGKVGIPDAILLKPGKLTPEEWTIMQRHAEIGGQILADSGFLLLDLARTIALTHHEKWDGSGYPARLRGEAIPLAGRIVAIADVFDALTSERPYKPAWPIEKAVALITEGAGRHFDPALVPLFARELPGLLEIRELFRDADVPGAAGPAWTASVAS
jgi:putative two-component system response regulator